MTPEEYRDLFKSNFIKNYFNEQVSILQDPNRDDEKRNLLPDLYINSNFFESLFGGNEIELNPQGSIGIDIVSHDSLYMKGIPIAEHVPDLTSKSDIQIIQKLIESKWLKEK